MTEAVYRAIADTASGFVEAAAGCGKTEAIVRTVGNFCQGPQLILTHTHAGVDALRRRFRALNVAASKYHIDTIAGWAWGWVRKYPANSGYPGSVNIAEWNRVYTAMGQLLQKDFVRSVIAGSYTGVIVDEYQDCTMTMHNLIVSLKDILPCRVLGDPLQGIFEFGEPLVTWPEVVRTFTNDLGQLETPYRWIKAGNENLGRWLIGSRPTFLQNAEPNFRGSPVTMKTVSAQRLSAELIGLTHQKQGRICVIRSKSHRLAAGIETALINQSYKLLENNELSDLREIIEVLAGGPAPQKAAAVLKFIKLAYSALDVSDVTFINKLLLGQLQTRLSRLDRKALSTQHRSGTNPALVLDILKYIERLDVPCKLSQSVSALKCILIEHLEERSDLKSLYSKEIARRKHSSRSNVFRCIGSTLLVKGLEFDHAIIVRGRQWGTNQDMYVALTRGAKSVTLLDVTR